VDVTVDHEEAITVVGVHLDLLVFGTVATVPPRSARG
jgi:hypothetical protein